MLKPNQVPVSTAHHPFKGNRVITGGRYRGFNQISTPGADGKAWFEGGQGGDTHVYLYVGKPEQKQESRPAAAPVHHSPVHHAPAFDFSGLPAFPNMPAPPKVETMPVQDDAKIRAYEERMRAMNRRGRTSTILSQNNQLN